jgi:hypothetical protein
MDERTGWDGRGRGFSFAYFLFGSVALALVIAASAAARGAAVPANTSPPTVSGTAQPGQTLTASTGSWSGSEPITFSYQWQRCDENGNGCGDARGATSATYTLQNRDANHTFRVVVTAKNGEGQSTAVSAVTAVAMTPPPAPKPGAPANTSLPTISGTATQGQTLTASTGSWSGNQPITFAYTWERCDTSGGHCGNIAGSNHPIYTLQKADVGRTIRVDVTAKNSVGNVSATSAQTGSVAATPAPAPPSVSVNLSTFRALYGTALTVSGSISNRQGGQTVTIEGQAYGSGKTTIGTAVTAADGSWSVRTKPGVQTTYDALWNGATSRSVTVGVMPLVTFHLITHKRFSTRVVAARSFAGKIIQFQRQGANGRWTTIKRVRLGSNSGAIFRTTLRASSNLRVAFSVNQAGAGYLGGVSRTLVVPQL